MTAYLYRFGYESPVEMSNNIANGSDFESSSGLVIDADSSEEALRWGREVSQAFVTWLFSCNNLMAPSWKASQFAHWLEPQGSEVWQVAEDLTRVRVGEMPVFELLL
jgi:hypothetical protein